MFTLSKAFDRSSAQILTVEIPCEMLNSVANQINCVTTARPLFESKLIRRAAHKLIKSN
jgi:hypothetical protein